MRPPRLSSSEASTISYGTAKILPAGAVIADGARVIVFADAVPTGTAPNLTLTAATVAVPSAELANKVIRLGGPITVVTPVSGQTLPNFTVDGINVDSSKASLKVGTTSAQLVVGAIVRVEGTLSAGTLEATEIEVVPPSAEREVILFGPISDFTSPSSFVVRGTAVDGARPPTRTATLRSSPMACSFASPATCPGPAWSPTRSPS